MDAGARNSSLVSGASGLRFPLVSHSKTALVAHPRERRPGDLVLPPPLPPKRGTRRPPSVADVARVMAPFCRQNGIMKLELFGSVARGEATAGSDVDLIATFEEHPGLEIVSIEEACEKLLGVPVHLLTAEAVAEMTNPYRKAAIERDRWTIYAA